MVNETSELDKLVKNVFETFNDISRTNVFQEPLSWNYYSTVVDILFNSLTDDEQIFIVDFAGNKKSFNSKKVKELSQEKVSILEIIIFSWRFLNTRSFNETYQEYQNLKLIFSKNSRFYQFNENN